MPDTNDRNGGYEPPTTPPAACWELIPRTFDPTSPDHVQQLTRLFADYLVEDFERTGNAPLGVPVAFFLRALTLWDGPTMVAFCSVDITRDSVELIYVTRPYRSQSIAKTLYRDLKVVLPELSVKGPLSPAGEALAAQIGLPVDASEQSEIDQAAIIDAELHRGVAAACRHKHGNPSRGCNRCYRTAMVRSARIVVTRYVATRELVSSGLAVLV